MENDEPVDEENEVDKQGKIHKNSQKRQSQK